MRIHELQLTNFKRFTDLTIKGIPDSAKLVLLIGSNGCGKSSIFDAFNWMMAPAKSMELMDQEDNDPYFHKNGRRSLPAVSVSFGGDEIKRPSDAIYDSYQYADSFYGRSSLRIPPRVKSPSYDAGLTEIMEENADSPQYFIDNDQRFFTDVHVHADLLNQAMQRLLVEGKIDQQATQEVRDKYISKINTALINIFGENDKKTLRFVLYKQPNPNKPVEPYFKKGDSEVPFELLSHGEKQVVIILFNFLVRQDLLKESLIKSREL